MKMAVIIHYYLHNLDQSRQQWEYSDLCLIRWGGGVSFKSVFLHYYADSDVRIPAEF